MTLMIVERNKRLNNLFIQSLKDNLTLEFFFNKNFLC